MLKRLAPLLALALAFGLTAYGCGGDEDAAQAGTDSEAELPGTDFGAAELRAGLTAGLEEHVYLAGVAFSTAAATGFDSERATASVETLDENSVVLSEAIGSVYGDEAGERFLEVWRAHIDDLVDYARARSAGDNRQAEAEIEDLDGYRQALGEFLAGANPDLSAEAVAAELKPYVNSLLKTIDVVVSGRGDQFEALRRAAGQMPGTAEMLAAAIAEQMPEEFSGDADSGAAELRAALTAGLQEHVYLAGIAIFQRVGNGLDSRNFKDAAAALDRNSVALGEAIASVYGTPAGEQFLETWRQHIGDFVLYTDALASGEATKVERAEQNLDGYRSALGAFLAEANPNLNADAVADELEPHVRSLFETIEVVVGGNGDPYEALRSAAGEMPGTALVLSNAIAQQMPEQFPTTAGGTAPS